MRKLLPVMSLALALTLPVAHAQTPAWTGAVQPTNPTPTDDTGALGRGLTVDAAGNQYVAGVLQNGAGSGGRATRVFGTTTLTGGNGYGSGFVAKLSPTQQWQWALKATSSGEGATFQETAVSPAGDTYAMGYVSDDASILPNGGSVLTVGSSTYTTTKDFASFITRLNASGQPQWLAGVSGAQIFGLGWDATAGNLVVAGVYVGTVTFGSTTLPAAPSTGLFVARLSATGQWVSAVGATTNGTASSSRFVVSQATVGPQGQAAIAFRIRNGAVTLGSTTITSTSATQATNVVAQLSAANQWAWAAQTSAPGTSSVAYATHDLRYDRAGNLLLTAESIGNGLQLGTTTVNADEFVARLSPTGQWGAVGTIGHGTASTSYTDALAVDGQGNAVLLGSFPAAATYTFGTRSLVSPATGSKFVARFNPTTTSWDYAQLAPASSGDGYGFEAAAVDGTGNLLATGNLRGGVTFGSTVLTNPTTFGTNAFVARLSNAGLPTAVRQPAGATPLALYPNPITAGTSATLRLAAPAATARPVVLRDALGRAVAHATIAAGSQEGTVATQNLAPGLYMLEAGTSRAQLIIE
ncbi:T9SS type A sorting domain-containing protein [Hymenobacter sp. DH14]|uniref:T9SS type A sorting domain-containing protein n=1 Tax=Hymenobacter cyanobacteriorum TaxID=2926463 RepID=A0A9X1VDX8_9BACT|nr:T9SS type A sorting domain-containing protein [Hymenobacter cyanobacteriorum]MCI1186823.1 T9SS type A sorting domain-containing protein [Hymenobacter cyanobacteriorum]